MPLEGAHPVARQSRFHGCPRTDPDDSPPIRGCPRTDFVLLHGVSSVAGHAIARWKTKVKTSLLQDRGWDRDPDVQSSIGRHHGPFHVPGALGVPRGEIKEEPKAGDIRGGGCPVASARIHGSPSAPNALMRQAQHTVGRQR